MNTSTEMELDAAYEVLGVSASMTIAEIRAVYWRITSEMPGRFSSEEARAAHERAALALQTLQRRTVTIEKTMMVGGYECRLVINETPQDYDHRTIYLPIEYCLKHSAQLRNFTALYATDEPTTLTDIYLRTYVVLDGGDEVYVIDDCWTLARYFGKMARDKQLEGPTAKFDAARKRLDELSPRPPESHAIFESLKDAETQLYYYREDFGHMTSYAKVNQAVAHFEHELDRLATTDQCEVAIEHLISGTSKSSAHPHNLQVMAVIDAAHVRTGGYIDRFTMQDLEEFYRQRLHGFTDPWAHLFDSGLRLDLNDFAPSDVVNDPDLDPAPLMAPFRSNRGEVDYQVHYFIGDDGRPCAGVRLPLKVYRQHEPAYGKKHSFPELPHGIVWFCAVEHDGHIIADGEVSEELIKRVDKWERGKARRKHSEEIGYVAEGLFGPSGFPASFKGDQTPIRRK